MLGNRNETLKHLDDLMVCRWENEGGSLGLVALADHGRQSNGYFSRGNDAERELVPSAVDRAMSDQTFVKEFVCQSNRMDREVRRRARTGWLSRTVRRCFSTTPNVSGPAC
jgi:hypothetical protein